MARKRMQSDACIRRKARAVAVAYLRCQAADGIFPDPEYDVMCESIEDMMAALGIDGIAEAEKWRQYYASLPR